MNTAPFESKVDTWLVATLSLTLRLFHGTVFAVIALIMFITLTLGSK